ncbi:MULTISPECIES: T9SS type A sorting domain-containing protein [unclassified Cellulophaga]|uniref:T9SS type A sorting domain-containing protein n=1 Tax=unclassified Cellulophaga TaxID=2634405 RepID=UPI0026E3DD25|nr:MULTISPECIES: T9SS type A sorting domain-containing protein [unclassified Cellulophaga]MDO6492498.1 T9SS type A sorting domain-containing protein [Cellulophaga sp. 2_MG-2023]MDO6493600.1 T9SS type A sorting domain-containing protein [Cellulophaga sp. 3_MG-2023]
MKKISLLSIFAFFQFLLVHSQYDWDNIPIPANAGSGKQWKLQTNASDDFNYQFMPTNSVSDFGPTNNAKWYNKFHNQASGQPNNWPGPGPTVWRQDHVAVSGGSLNIWASRIPGATKSFVGSTGSLISRPETRAGCITNKTRVKYPVFVEASIKVMNSSLASDIWLLSPDDTQEIDIIECYGGPGDDNRNSFFSNKIHLSHHVFIRPPNFKDYQPADVNSWWSKDGVSQWGGRVVRIGVNWVSPTRLEYYVDGQMVRVLDDTAVQTRLADGTWQYTYPAGVTSTGVNGELDRVNGYQKMKIATSLNDAKNKSNISVIDPFNYLRNGRKFTKEMDIIINVEDQSWQAEANRSSTDEELDNFEDNNLLVNWIRVYKPVASNSAVNSGVLNSGSFDFGSKSSALFPNYTRVSYGLNDDIWTTKNGVNYADRGSFNGTNDLNRDFAYGLGNTRTLQFTVENGTYDVTATFGDRLGPHKNNAINCGNKSVKVSTKTGEYKNAVLRNVVVSNGVLKVDVSASANEYWSLNRLTFAKSNTAARALISTEKIAEEELTVFPIPAKNTVNISNTDYVQAKVYNLQGLVVLRKDIADGKLNVSSLENGMYVLELAKKNGESTKQKIVISK